MSYEKQFCVKRYLLAVVVSALVSVALALPAGAATTERLSLDTLGGDANGASRESSVSSDGRYVAFQSDATDLVDGDTTGFMDIFVLDRQTGVIVRVSVDSQGNAANGDSSYPSISGDGRLVAFQSNATNLAAVDTDTTEDIYVHNLDTGDTVIASVSSIGIHTSYGFSVNPRMAADGSCVVFWSRSNGLVSTDSNSQDDVFVHDIGTGTTTMESVDSLGVPGDANSQYPDVSADCSVVVFESYATNLVASDGNGLKDIYLHNRNTGVNTRVSLVQGGGEPDGVSSYPCISGDGRYVGFTSLATNLVADDANGTSDIFLTYVQSGETTRVSVDPAGNSSHLGLGSNFCALSHDGRFTAFQTTFDLTARDTNTEEDIYVHDRIKGHTLLMSVAPDGSPVVDGGFVPDISSDGRTVTFESLSSEIDPTDGNLAWDIFARDWAYQDTLGVYRGGLWYFDVNSNGGWDPGVDVEGYFGLPGDTPVVGDVNSYGLDDSGVYRGGLWYFDVNNNGAWDAGVDFEGVFGLPTDTPVVGDVNGDGVDDPGVYRGGLWYFDVNNNGAWDPGTDFEGFFGLPTDIPVCGRVR